MSVEVLTAREVLISEREEQVVTEMNVRKEVAGAEVLTAVAVELAVEVALVADQAVEQIARGAVEAADQEVAHQGRNSIE
jgi:hypothetical protein